MAYNAITNPEVASGAIVDSTLLTKVKDNFDVLKTVSDTHEADIDDLKTQDPWIVPALTGGWTYYEPAQTSHPGLGYYKDEMGTVHLRGMIKGATGTNFYTLPAGYRPSKYLILIAWAAAGACRIDIDTSGVMLHNGGAVATSWVSLAGISFRAEQ